MSDTVRHFKNRALLLVVKTQRTTHRFMIRNSPWERNTMERMVPEEVHTLKVLLNEGRHPLVGWVQVVPVMQ